MPSMRKLHFVVAARKELDLCAAERNDRRPPRHRALNC